VPAWDPSFVVLAMVASVEAIFLSTFVLISQNRMAAAADKRADLDLQVSLLAEHEITRLVTLVSGIADRMGVRTEADADLKEITLDVAPRPCSTSSRRRNREPSSIEGPSHPESAAHLHNNANVTSICSLDHTSDWRNPLASAERSGGGI